MLDYMLYLHMACTAMRYMGADDVIRTGIGKPVVKALMDGWFFMFRPEEGVGAMLVECVFFRLSESPDANKADMPLYISAVKRSSKSSPLSGRKSANSSIASSTTRSG